MSFTMVKNKTELGFTELCFILVLISLIIVITGVFESGYFYNNPSVFIKETIENSIPVRKHDIVRLFS
ncbi:hypothetical protein COJ21_24915 [Priestia megaterium]|nr:hypothetical protein COJ21_24915 [Priestia megaterium]